MSEILRGIRETYKTIRNLFVFFGAINGLVRIQTLIDLENQRYSGQISIETYLIQVLLHYIILSALPSIIIGYFIHQKGTTVIIASTDLETIKDYTTRNMVIEAGKLL